MREDNENKEYSIIVIINLLTKVIVILSVVGVILYKLISTPIDLSNFDFSDLLSVILAIFSIMLAVMFYYKATDTSNLFYDNTYKFTKDISIILGRIEAGFGERLKHLDEGYSGIRDKIYQTPSSETSTKKEIEKEEKELQKVIMERDKIIEDLAKRAELQAEEKHSILTSLMEKDRELDTVRNTMNKLQSKIEESRRRGTSQFKEPEVISYFLKRINRDKNVVGLPNSKKKIQLHFLKTLDDYPTEWINDAIGCGYIDEDRNITKLGIEVFLANMSTP